MKAKAKEAREWRAKQKDEVLYTWDDINLVLMNLGYAPARILDVLYKLHKVQEQKEFYKTISPAYWINKNNR